MFFLLWSFLLFQQSPSSDETVLKQLEEFEKMDCQKIFESAKSKCLSRCSSPELKKSGKEAVQQCENMCNNSFGESLVQQCSEAQKGVKGLSPKERRELLKEDPEKEHMH